MSVYGSSVGVFRVQVHPNDRLEPYHCQSDSEVFYDPAKLKGVELPKEGKPPGVQEEGVWGLGFRGLGFRVFRGKSTLWLQPSTLQARRPAFARTVHNYTPTRPTHFLNPKP